MASGALFGLRVAGARGTFREPAPPLHSMVTEAGVLWLRAEEEVEITDRKVLDQKLDEMLKIGGEGLTRYPADARATTGLRNVLLKFNCDMTRTPRQLPANRARENRPVCSGALRVRTADGAECPLGTGLNDAGRRNPPRRPCLIGAQFYWAIAAAQYRA